MSGNEIVSLIGTNKRYGVATIATLARCPSRPADRPVFSVARDGNWKEHEDNQTRGYIREGWQLEVCGGAPNECLLCSDMDGKIISIKAQGPPFHLGCRCATNLVIPL